MLGCEVRSPSFRFSSRFALFLVLLHFVFFERTNSHIRDQKWTGLLTTWSNSSVSTSRRRTCCRRWRGAGIRLRRWWRFVPASPNSRTPPGMKIKAPPRFLVQSSRNYSPAPSCRCSCTTSVWRIT